MSVTINIPANTDRNFYAEVVNIAFQYRKLKKKPEARLSNMKREATIYLAISAVLAAVSFAYIITKGSTLMSILIVLIMAACAGLSFAQLNTINKMTNSYMKNAGDSIMTLNEESITLEKIGEQALTLNWSNAMFIRFLNNTICMISKDEPAVLMVIGIRHKDEIMGFIRENNIKIPVIG